MKKQNKTNIFTCAAVAAALCLSASAYAQADTDLVITEEPQHAAVDFAEKPISSPPYNPDTDSLPQRNDSVQGSQPFRNLPTGTGEVEDLYKYWETNGYPDYVSYAAEIGMANYEPATGTETVYRQWTIGTVNATEEQKREIISLASPDYYIDFEDARYSHAYRKEMAEKICQSYPKAIAELSDGSETIYIYNDAYDGYTDEEWADIVKAYANGIVVDGGVYDRDMGMGVPEIGDEEIAPALGVDNAAPTDGIGINDIAVDSREDGMAPSTKSAGTVSEASSIGGDVDAAPHVNASNNYSGGDAETPVMNEGDHNGASGGNQDMAMLPAVQKKADPIYMWIFISAVSVITAATAAFVILRKAKKNAMVTTAGNTVAVSSSPTKAEIVKAVRDSGTEPDDNAFKKIMEEINK